MIGRQAAVCNLEGVVVQDFIIIRNLKGGTIKSSRRSLLGQLKPPTPIPLSPPKVPYVLINSRFKASAASFRPAVSAAGLPEKPTKKSDCPSNDGGLVNAGYPSTSAAGLLVHRNVTSEIHHGSSS